MNTHTHPHPHSFDYDLLLGNLGLILTMSMVGLLVLVFFAGWFSGEKRATSSSYIENAQSTPIPAVSSAVNAPARSVVLTPSSVMVTPAPVVTPDLPAATRTVPDVGATVPPQVLPSSGEGTVNRDSSANLPAIPKASLKLPIPRDSGSPPTPLTP